jgi:PAS domain S-box-containing protein
MEEEFSRVFDALPGMVWTALPDGHVEFLNRRLCEYSGLSLHEAGDMEWSAIIHSADLPGFLEFWRSTLASREPGEIEVRLRRSDGEYRWFLISASPLRDDASHVARWYGFNTDIDDRKKMEERQSQRCWPTSVLHEEHLRSILDALPAFVLLMRPEGGFEFANRRLLDYFGASLEEIKRWPSVSTLHPDDGPQFFAAWKQALERGIPFDCEGRHRRADGVYCWFHMRGFPLQDEEGSILLLYLLQKNIDEPWRPKKALWSSEHDLRSLIDTIPMTAWSTRADGYCDFVNQRWLDYAGLTLDHVQGWGWRVAIHPDDLNGLVEAWQSCLTTGTPVNAEARMRRFDGVYRWFLFLGNPLRDEAGNIVKWFGTNVDIEDRKQADEALRTSERNLIRIINTIPTTAWSTRPDGYCDFLSDRWLDYAGFSAEEAVGWRWATAIHPDDAAALQEHWLGCLASGTPVNAEARIRRFDGVYRWFLFLGNPFHDESGNIVKWYGTNVDIEDRKRADEALQASARSLNQIVNSIPALAWSARPDGSAEFFNQHYLEYVGLSQEEVRRWGWTVAVHVDDLEGLDDAWQRMRASEAAGEFEGRLRRWDGEYRWFLFRTNPFRDESGKIVRWYGINTDIHDRKQSEDDLRHSEARKAAILDSALDCVMTIDHEGCITEFNPAAVRTFGYQRNDIVGKRLMDVIIPPSLREKHKQGFKRYLETGETNILGKRMEWSAIRADGSEFPIELSISRIQLDGPPSFTGYLRDITERKRADEELRRSEAFLAEGQRLNLTGTFCWCLDTDEITVSEQLYRIYEFDQDAPVTLALIISRVHPEDLPLVSDKIERARGGHNDLNYEFRLRMPDESVKYLRTVAHVTHSSNGRLELVGAVQDVTERRLSEEALSKIRSELAHIARVTSLGALTASIAHEVNQPLSGIVTNASTCLRMLAADPPNVDGALETARRTIRDGKRASDVIKKLRGLFGKKEVAIESVDLNEATREVVALSLSELQRNRVIARLELADDLPSVRGDRVQLQQVILNLILNASDALKGIDDRPRHLTVRTEADEENCVRLTVQDTGVGIDAQDLDKLFDAFFSTKHAGMGMGLSVSRTIIESHHGRLWAKANEGPGATFSFAIPCGPEDFSDGQNRNIIRMPAEIHAAKYTRDI